MVFAERESSRRLPESTPQAVKVGPRNKASGNDEKQAIESVRAISRTKLYYSAARSVRNAGYAERKIRAMQIKRRPSTRLRRLFLDSNMRCKKIALTNMVPALVSTEIQNVRQEKPYYAAPIARRC